MTDGKPGAYEYTGVIGISGARKGIVYFTAPRGMLTVLADAHAGDRLQ